MYLVVLHGLPGVGKLTVGRYLQGLTGYRLFHNHLVVDLVESLFDFGSSEFVSYRELLWLKSFDRASRAGLRGVIFTFAAERTVSGHFISDMASSCANRGDEPLFVELRCRVEELERRVRSPDRQRYGKMVSVEKLRQLREESAVFDMPQSWIGEHPRLRVDTTELSPQHAAEQIHSHLTSGRQRSET